MWITHLSQTVLSLSQLAAQTTLADTNEADGNHTDDEDDPSDDQPELFSVMDLDEENDIRTELNNHPSVKRLTKTLNQQALFRGVPITAPTQKLLLMSIHDDSNQDSRGSSSKRPRADDEEAEESTPRPTATITTKRSRVRSLKFLHRMHH